MLEVNQNGCRVRWQKFGYSCADCGACDFGCALDLCASAQERESRLGCGSASSQKCLVIGHARHGKDTAGQMVADATGQPWVSSSEFCAQKAVFPLVADLYPDWRACFEDRDNHRQLWFHAIAAYNLRPGPMLAEQILEGHGIYVGMRRRAEFEQVRHLFDVVLWVDAAKRLPPEPDSSMELTAADADVVLDNNLDESHMRTQIFQLFGVH